MTRVAAIAVAIAATALWLNVAIRDRSLFSRSGIGAMMFTGLLAVLVPLPLRKHRAVQGVVDDGARVAAVVAAAVLVLGSVAFTDHYVVAAHFGDGTPGIIRVFIAESSGTTEWSGPFFVRRGGHGPWVAEPNAPWSMTTAGPGQGLSRSYVPAIDVGDRDQLYPPDGGIQWADITTVAIADAAASCALLGLVLLLRYRRGRRSALA